MGKNLPKEVKKENRINVSVLKRRKSIEDYHMKSVSNATKRLETFKQHKPWKAKASTIGTKRQRLRPAKEFFLNSMRREHIHRKMNMRLKHIDGEKMKTPISGEPLFFMLMQNPVEIPPLGKELLTKYRLEKMYDAVLVAGSEPFARDVHILGEYVSVVNANEPEVFDLIRQKARYKSDTNEAQPLTNNLDIEKHLGQLGVICIEDIMEILKKGSQSPLFEDITQFLLPFNLAPPKSEIRGQKRSKYSLKHTALEKSIPFHLSAKYKLN